jgi:hypothetical protein
MQGSSFLILDLICHLITNKAMSYYVKILIGWPHKIIRSPACSAGERCNEFPDQFLMSLID